MSGLILSYKSRCRCILSIHLDTAKKPWSYYNTHRQEIKNHQPLCSHFLSAFKTVKTKKEQAYSQCAKALLYIMIQAFKKQQPDYDKFDEYLSDVPNKYREELRCDSLSRNSERLYANLYSFFESGDHKQVYGL